VEAEEPNLLRALALAFGPSGDWHAATAVVDTLAALYERRGRMLERIALLDRGFDCVGTEAPAAAASDRLSFWHALVSKAAVIAQERADYARAEQLYHAWLHILDESEGSGDDHNVGVVYHGLGWLAHNRREYDRAEELLQKAAAVFERLGVEHGLGSVSHQLGILALERGEWDAAEVCFGTAMDIRLRLKLGPDAAKSLQGLSNAARGRGDLSTAEACLLKAVEVEDLAGLEADAAMGRYSLGLVASKRDDYDAAEAWHRSALEVFERLQMEEPAAAVYNQLGRCAWVRGILTRARPFQGAGGLRKAG
jgi:tetratricopeptide (TPR) repeat protein